MRIAAAFLATQVTMPEGAGILNVLDAGVSWIDRPSYPAPLSLRLAIFVQPAPEEYGTTVDMTMEIRDESTSDISQPGLKVAALKGKIEPTLNATANGDSFGVLVPLVIDLGSVPIPFHGHYRIKLCVGNAETAVDFQARVSEA
ncbi:DUF6941 family protein [Rhodococcus qingshengii]|uniref:DUF6941 family protein n=1 Tax=Rhodococcus qingshengii TaxID=334542 RepID=UPI00210C113A|nr:hypothetical protein [Rhodococcus qingshengii]MCQ4148564.1 hypothetical protein [Rhodococcus qingshengii]